MSHTKSPGRLSPSSLLKEIASRSLEYQVPLNGCYAFVLRSTIERAPVMLGTDWRLSTYVIAFKMPVSKGLP